MISIKQTLCGLTLLSILSAPSAWAASVAGEIPGGMGLVSDVTPIPTDDRFHFNGIWSGLDEASVIVSWDIQSGGDTPDDGLSFVIQMTNIGPAWRAFDFSLENVLNSDDVAFVSGFSVVPSASGVLSGSDQDLSLVFDTPIASGDVFTIEGQVAFAPQSENGKFRITMKPTIVPMPAALPAGLALLGGLALMRRRASA